MGKYWRSSIWQIATDEANSMKNFDAFDGSSSVVLRSQAFAEKI